MNNNLQNMFNKAKSQPPLISEDELSNLLNHQLSPKNNLLQKFKGVPTMFKLSFAVAIVTLTGLLSLNFLDDDHKDSFIAEVPDITTKNAIVQESNVPLSQNVIEQEENNNFTNEEVSSKISANENDTEQNSETEEKSLFSPVDIKGVHIIKLSPEDLSKIGITLDKEKKFITFKENHEKVTKLCTLYVDGNFEMTLENDSEKTIAPKLITDNKGNKRYFVVDFGKTRIAHAIYDEETFNPEGKNKILKKKMVLSFDEENDSLYNSSSFSMKKDTILKFLNSKIDEKIKSNDLNFDSLFNNTDNNHRLIFGTKKINIDSILKDLNIQSNNLANIDSILDKINMNIDVEKTDDNNIKIIINSQIDKSDFLNTKDNTIIIKHNNEDSIHNDLNIEKISSVNIDINKLLPIEIKLGKVDVENDLINKDNFSFILWFEPDEKLLEILPQDIKEKLSDELKELMQSDNICEQTAIAGKDPMLDTWRSCNGSLENLTISPNPATDFANVSFHLTDTRNITLTLHDVNGNIIAKLMNNKTLKPGEYSYKFNMNKYQSGIYLLSAQSDAGEIAVQRIVIER